MNFYSCQQMFTEGQKARVLQVLNSTVAQRDQLWLPSNVLLAGACMAVSVAERVPTSGLRVYPNPFQDWVVVEECAPGLVLAEFFSLDGRMELTVSFTSSGGRLSFVPGGAQQPGAHVLRVTDALGTHAVLLFHE